MTGFRTVLYITIILLKLLYPACKLALRGFEVQKPAKCCMHDQYAGQNFVHKDSNESDELLSPLPAILYESHSIDVLLDLGSD